MRTENTRTPSSSILHTKPVSCGSEPGIERGAESVASAGGGWQSGEELDWWSPKLSEAAIIFYQVLVHMVSQKQNFIYFVMYFVNVHLCRHVCVFFFKYAFSRC